MRTKPLFLLGLTLCTLATAQVLEPKPNDACFEKFNPLKAPRPSRLLLHRGDRLAICGDSITEQKMYSRLMEDYLTMCVPELRVSIRQYGWGGERAPGFLARMTNDCLRFKPTIATTCYGMNDHEYRPYEARIGETYRKNSMAIIEAFKTHGVNLAEAFPSNPFCEAFARVDAAVAAKQAYETRQIKKFFHSPEAKTNMVEIVARTEKERQPLVRSIKTAFAPVTHTLRIVAEP